MATLSRPVREHLRAIILSERARTSRVLALLRAAGTMLNLVPTLWFGGVQGVAEWRVVLPIFTAYAMAAVLLAIGVHRSPALQRRTGFEIGLLDIPVIGLAAALNRPFLPDPSFLLGSYVPVLCLGIVLSALSLDFVAIGLATVSATVVTTALVVFSMHANTEELFGPVLSITFIGGATMYLVSRVRGLVAESRRKDFAGKYVLGERIGAGGMAEVFTATYAPEGGFERRVAVKRVLPSHSDNEEFVALFRREAELGARLAHPNLVQVLDFGKHLDSWFLAMEFVDGASLASLVRGSTTRSAPLPLAASLYVLAELAEGLTYLHEKATSTQGEVGLVHRDLNPPNVLISRVGEVKISDFGVARWQTGEGLTGTGVTRGKLGYMPPEQIEGGRPGPHWDLFAFGVTAHELLCGRRLFAAETDAAVLRLVLEAPVAPPSDFRPEVPPEIDALVLQLVDRREAGQLRPSAREVSRRLRALEGPAFGLAQGRGQLVEALASLGPVAAAQAPTPASTDEARTATISRLV